MRIPLATRCSSPAEHDGFLDRHHAIEVGDQAVLCKARQVGIPGPPASLYVAQLVRLHFHQRRHLEKRPLPAGAGHITGLAEDHESTDCGLSDIALVPRGIGRGVCEWTLRIQAKDKPVLAQHTIALLPGLQGSIDGVVQRISLFWISH